MNYIPTCAVILLLSTGLGCETLIPANYKSFQTETEQILIEIIPREAALLPKTDGSKEAAPAILAMAIPLVAEYAIKKTVAAIDDETKKYTAVYSGIKPESKFYADGGEAPTLRFGGVKITRTIDKDGVRTPASELTFLADNKEQQPNGMLQLVGDTASVEYAKAKVADSRWYLPWTWFQSNRDVIDIDVNVTLEAHWLDDKGTSHKEDVADLNLPLRSIKLGSKTDISKVRSEWFPIIPRSTTTQNANIVRGTGTYVVKAKVTEYDDYGKRVKALSEFISKNQGDWLKQLKDSLSK